MHHFVTLARYYNVSLDYLAGMTKIPKPLKEEKSENKLTEKDKRLIKAYHESPKLQNAVDKLLDLK